LVADSRRSYQVPALGAGERLDHHLSAALADLSRARIKHLIEQGRVKVDGKRTKPARRLKGGERVEIEIPPPVSAKPQAERLPLEILYQDQDIAVINKAAGMVVHPGAGNWQGTLVNALLFSLSDLSGIGGELRPGLVHRLDKGTSGCIVVAKNDFALASLQAQFKSGSVEKIYLALVHGQPPATGRFETAYGRHPVHRTRFTARVKSGRSALTEYQVRERLADAALVEVRLLTGRTHQVRVHFSEAGHPLVGDLTYGAGRRATGPIRQIQQQLGRPALHAWRLRFPHPRTGQPACFEAPVPKDFQAAIEALRKRV
jgi:23S rRNA pseudouridine1911/1915/1917 synthase